MKKRITVMFLLLLVSGAIYSQTQVLDLNSDEAYAGTVNNKMCFLTHPFAGCKLRIFAESGQVEKEITMPCEFLLNECSEFLIKDQYLYTIWAKGPITGVDFFTTSEELKTNACILKIDSKSGNVTKIKFPVSDKADFIYNEAFFNADSTRINFACNIKESKKNRLMSVLSFDLDLKLINTVSLNIGELEDNDLPLSLAADKANVIKILYRKEVKGSVRKVLKKFFKYTIFEIDQNSKVDSTEVFKDLKYNKSYINWVWDASRNTCFLSSYVAGDDNDMQTGARFEKYNSKVKNVVLRDYNFNNDFMQKFREKPVNLPYLSYFCFDGLHLASNGDLFAVGEFYDDNYYKAPLRKETIKMKYAEGQKNRNLTGGPFMIFKLKNTLEIEWVKEFDKYFNEGLFAGAWSSDFEFIKRDQVNFFSNGKLKLFFIDDISNSDLIEGHPFKMKSAKFNGKNAGVFELIIDSEGKAEKKLLFGDIKKSEPAQLLYLSVKFPLNGKYLLVHKTLAPTF